PVAIVRLREEDVSLLQVPPDDRLGPGLLMGGGDIGDDGAGVVDLALAQRSPGFDPDVLLGQDRAGVDLLELRVALDLVDGGHDAGVEDLGQEPLSEVREAERGRQSLLAVAGEGLPGRARLVVARGRPVYEVEVVVVVAERLEALAERTLGLLGSVAIVPQLGGDEELVTGDAGLRDGAAQALFIAVDCRGGDVTSAAFDGGWLALVESVR